MIRPALASFAAALLVAPLAPSGDQISVHGITQHSVDVEFPASEKQFPGANADAINGNCLTCHSAGMILTQPVFPRAKWQEIVDKMRNTYKAPIDPADIPAIVDYLVALKDAR